MDDTRPLHIDHIVVPPDTPWRPDMATQIMRQLAHNLVEPIFYVQATATSLDWLIWHRSPTNDLVKNVFQTYVPGSEIRPGFSVYDKSHLEHDDLYHISFEKPSAMPIKGASDFKLDPLAAMTSTMQSLRDGEFLRWLVFVIPPESNHQTAMRNELLPKATGCLTLILSGVLAGLLSIFFAAYRSENYGTSTDTWESFLDQQERTRLKTTEGKIEQPIYKCGLMLQIKAANELRRTELAYQFEGALKQWEEPGFNRFRWGNWTNDEGYPTRLTLDELAGLWHPPTKDLKAKGITFLEPTSSRLPEPMVDVPGVRIGKTKHRGQDIDVHIPYESRDTHMNLLGATGMGKSTLLVNLIVQDMLNDKGLGVLDPHGSLIADLMRRIPDGRLDDVILFDVTDSHVGLNVLTPDRGTTINYTASHTVSLFRKVMQEDWSPTRMERAMYAAVACLAHHPGATVKDLIRLFQNDDFRAGVLKRVPSAKDRDFFENDYNRRSEAQQLQISEPVANRISKLYRDDRMERIVCATNCLDFRRIMDEGKILLMNMGGLDDFSMEMLGSLIISKMQMAAMGRPTDPKPRPFYLFVDEAQRFVTTSFPTILSEARKYGLALHMANQALYQIEGDTQKSMFANVSTNIIFRCRPPDDAIVARLVSKEISQEELGNLNPGQAVVKTQVNRQTQPAFYMITYDKPPEKARPLFLGLHTDAILKGEIKRVEMLRNRWHLDRMMGKPDMFNPEVRRRYIISRTAQSWGVVEPESPQPKQDVQSKHDNDIPDPYA